jgi:SAM-dependent methyltransferase
MGLFLKCINQTRKPEGTLGKLMLKGMNFGHAKTADWGMSQLEAAAPERIAEIGCGGGRNAAELLKKFPGARVTAIDYSPLSVQQTTAYNKDAVLKGRCVVRQGDVSSLDFADGSFDLATAFETVYFWPGLGNCFAEVCRILKPGGCFLVVNESDGQDEAGKKFEKMIDGMKLYTAEEIGEAMGSAGFTKVKTVHHGSQPWIAVLAEK